MEDDVIDWGGKKGMGEGTLLENLLEMRGYLSA